MPHISGHTQTRVTPPNVFLKGLAELSRGEFFPDSNTQQGQVPLGDRMPDTPHVATTPTGISSPGQGTFDDQGNPIGQTQTELGQAVPDALVDSARNQLISDRAIREEAGALQTDITTSRDETTALIDDERTDLQASEERFQADLQTQKEVVQQIPGQVTSEFERLRAEFGSEAEASFDRIESRSDDALGDVMKGRAAAMEAAVQGTQGTVNSQIAQIQANPNLTAGQKASMIAQTKLQGAASLGATIGETQLAFNKLSADVSLGFANIIGNLEGVVIGAKGQLTGLQGTAFTNAQIAVGQMTNQLLEIDANATAAFASSQSQLLGMRSQAQMAGNDLLMQLLPEMGVPFLDLTNAAVAAWQVGSELTAIQLQRDFAEYGMEVNLAYIRELQGTPMGNAAEAALGAFFQTGSPVAGVAAAAGSFLAEPPPGERI